ncbi:MAG: class I SAM-dependent methyltransferase [Chthoniobacterales bacterium]
MAKMDLLPRSWRRRKSKANLSEPLPMPFYGVWDRISQFAAEIRSSPFTAEMMRRRTEFGKMGLMAALDCATLYALTRVQRPMIVVESGGFVGLSAAFILKALTDEQLGAARLYSIEMSDECEHGALIPAELRAQFVPVHGKVEELVRNNQLPAKIDLFLHDSSHRYHHMKWEFRQFWDRLGEGGMLVSHDVNMTGAFAEFVASTYAHDKKSGLLDYARTAHHEWGRWGYLGFIIKKDGETKR